MKVTQWKHSTRTHTHTQLHLFDRVVLRCLPADLVVEEETVGGFLAYLWFGGVGFLHRGGCLMCVCIICRCLEPNQASCSRGLLSSCSSSYQNEEEGFAHCSRRSNGWMFLSAILFSPSAWLAYSYFSSVFIRCVIATP